MRKARASQHRANGPKELVPFHRPWLGAAEQREILATLKSGWLTTGARTRALEQAVAEYVGSKHAVAVSSGTAALHVALAALEVGPGDEVITTPITFASTANVIVLQGAKPVFVDVEPDTLNVDAEQIESRISRRTKVILPVHLYGQPCDMETVLRVAQRHRLLVAEDAAHALGTEYHGRRVGNFGDLTCFSLYATKNITTGEGGMVTTDHEELAAKVRLLSIHGITADSWQRHGDGGFVHWDVVRPGYKYNLSDIHAALGIHQLKKIEAFWRRRKRCVEMYNAAFQEVPEIRLIPAKGDVKHAHHLYPILLKTEDLTSSRDAVLQALKEAGIGAGVHFRALHLTSFYSKTFGFKPGDFPHAEYASERLLSLPLYPKMTGREVRRVITQLKDILRRVKKKKTF
ncbi:MAG: DegT/DnrJ/EryC1/StrS aminotransferase family protein [Deltaproteobacteria bacterium]|nr:DegT/DnrJ/EryC1/StrS aminotransferase family protein [Deltaproteobacteria bacterium]